MLPVTEAAPIVVDSPVQIAVLDPAFAAGNAFTVTVMLWDAIHPFELVSVTVYVVFEVGLAVGLDTLELVRFVVGLQL